MQPGASSSVPLTPSILTPTLPTHPDQDSALEEKRTCPGGEARCQGTRTRAGPGRGSRCPELAFRLGEELAARVTREGFLLPSLPALAKDLLAPRVGVWGGGLCFSPSSWAPCFLKAVAKNGPRNLSIFLWPSPFLDLDVLGPIAYICLLISLTLFEPYLGFYLDLNLTLTSTPFRPIFCSYHCCITEWLF